MQISLCTSLKGGKGREGKVKSEINRPAMQSDTSYDVSSEGWRYTSPYKKFKKVFCRSNEDDDQGTPYVVCGMFLIFCVEDGICRSKTGSGFKKNLVSHPYQESEKFSLSRGALFFVPGKNNETISKERRKEKP